MSRSRRKTPIAGITTASSDKHDKRLASRRNRRVNRVILNLTADDSAMKSRKATGDPWEMSKDGKRFFRASVHPVLMRK